MDLIEKLAREHGTGGWQTLEDMVRFGKAVAEAEREACAKVCEAMKTRPPSEVADVERGYNASLRRAAEAIRLRCLTPEFTAKPLKE